MAAKKARVIISIRKYIIRFFSVEEKRATLKGKGKA
jgi:hypothetical protein